MKLLVIEDEPDLLDGLARMFRRAGYAVDMASDGEEGLYKAESAEYDAVVLDVMLPRMDGWSVLAKLRVSKTTPVLMLTARDSASDKVRGLDSGADDYLAKPFNREELLARVRALIRRSANQPRPLIELGPVEIDTSARQVKRAGQTVILTAREYAVLEYLARRRGEVVTRMDLHEHLFDENDSTLSNLVDVHVSNLRKKLGEDFIVTRRGQGYGVDLAS